MLREPDVGETGILEGVAPKIVEGEVPENLRRKRLVVMPALMLAGRTRLQRLATGVKEVCQARDVILILRTNQPPNGSA